MGKKTIGVVVAGSMLVAGGTIWALRAHGTDPQVQKVQELRAGLSAEKLPPEKRREKWEQLRKEMEQLTPEQRDEVRHQMHEEFRVRQQQQLDAYFALPPAQRIAYLDKQIDEMEQRRKQWQSQRPAQAAGKAQGQAGPRGPGSGRGMNAEARAKRSKRRLDRSSPEERAKRTVYFEDLRKRRAARGLPPLGPPRR